MTFKFGNIFGSSNNDDSEKSYQKGVSDGKNLASQDNAFFTETAMREIDSLNKQTEKYRTENEALKERVAQLLTERITLLDSLTIERFPQYAQEQAKEQADDRHTEAR